MDRIRSKTSWLEYGVALRNYHRWILVVIELIVIGLANPAFWTASAITIMLFIVSFLSAFFDITVSIAERIVWKRIPQEKENPTPRVRYIIGDFMSAVAFLATWIWQLLIINAGAINYTFYRRGSYYSCEILAFVGSSILWIWHLSVAALSIRRHLQIQRILETRTILRKPEPKDFESESQFSWSNTIYETYDSKELRANDGVIPGTETYADVA